MAASNAVPDSFTLFSFLDEVESRVEMLRRQAVTIKQDQDSLLLILDQLKEESLQSAISPGECQELIANMQRLRERCQAVEVHIHTVRDERQLEALEKVNKVLDELEIEVTTNNSSTMTVNKRAHSLLNACLPEAVGAVDTRFQSMVLGCALDDQKAVRQRLHCLVRQYCCQPNSHCRPQNSSPCDTYATTISTEQSSGYSIGASDELSEQKTDVASRRSDESEEQRDAVLNENSSVFRLNDSVDGDPCVSGSR